MASALESASILRAQFFGFLFGEENKGYVCIATADKAKQNFRQKFFAWPSEQREITAYLDSVVDNRNVWFCTSLLSGAERKKEFCLPGTFAWADLDATEPDTIDPKPSAVVESSPGRYQGYWKIKEGPVPADVVEDFSRRIAYKFNADKSGWDLTQLLRVPFTRNFKYDPPADIRLLSILSEKIPVHVLDEIEPPTESNGSDTLPVLLEPMPDPTSLPDIENILYRYKAEGKITETFVRLYVDAPNPHADWSRILWRFIKTCLEMGMTREETFVTALNAKCNKYARDNRPVQYLWRDIVKADSEQSRMVVRGLGTVELLKMPQLVDPDEFEEDAFIKEYKDWANQATDAPEQYHELSCFISLSAVVCSGLYLKVEWGQLVPNLWGLVLGESTLTRKTTAMRLATDMIIDIDESLILATDGSAEGLLSGLSHRPQRVSIFFKDEVSGLFDSINRKDYLAGLPETLTQLYDVPKVLTRLLRKETVTISEPYLIFFGGGIRDKVYSLLNDEYILSGFLPRFLVVSGENDLSRIRRTGPPTAIGTERKDNILRSLADLRDRYNATVPVTIAGQTTEMSSRVEARLTSDAWELFGTIEETLTNAGASSDIALLALPTFTRLAFSILKMGMLVAASRREPSGASILTVERSDIAQAAYYGQKWGHYSIDLILNSGKSKGEKMIDKAMLTITKREGLTRAEFMQRMHLSARDAKDLIDTLVQRGMVDQKPQGRGHRLYTITE